MQTFNAKQVIAASFCFATVAILSPDATSQTTEHRLVPAGAVAGDFSGSSVAVGQRIAVVGARGADSGAADSGAAYVLGFDGSTWAEVTKLTAGPDASAGAAFGCSVALDAKGQTIVVGARGESLGQGAAYVFSWNGSSWQQTGKLLASDGAADDAFGFSVDVDGGTALIGAMGRGGKAGACYVFELGASGWQETAILVPGDLAGGDQFGNFVSLDGDTALIGSPADDDRGSNSGSAYVFTRTAGAWTQSAKLVAADGGADDLLALSGGLSGGTAVIGARGDDDRASMAGAVYVFQLQGGAWNQTAKLLANDGRASDVFGQSVAISGNRIVAGAKWRDDNGSSSGAAYVFELSAGTWRQIARLNASDATAGAEFGDAVAIHRKAILIGAHRTAADRGAAYVYQEPDSVDANLSTVTADDATISAYGGTTRIVVTPKLSDGAVFGAGLTVQMAATGGQMAGTVVDHGDGTYSQTLQAAPGPAAIVVSATAGGVAITQTATVSLAVISADDSSIDVSPVEVTAGEHAMVTVTPRLTNGNLAGAGHAVTIQTTLGSLVGTVADAGNGTYTQRINTSAAGTAQITATVNGVDLTDSAALVVNPAITGNVVGIRSDNSSVPYQSIQQAVLAVETDGLVKILVAPGVHEESVRISKLSGLTLEAMPNLGLTTIRGLSIHKSTGITVVGFDIEATGSRKGGLFLDRSETVVVRNLIVRGAPGCGLVVHRCGDVLIDQCLVRGNGGNGVHVQHGTKDLRMLRSTVSGNDCGGVFIADRAGVLLQGCEISDNGAGQGNRGRHGCRHGHHGGEIEGYGVYMSRHGKHSTCNPERVTLRHNDVQRNRGQKVPNRSDENFGNYDRFIDGSDDQSPFNR